MYNHYSLTLSNEPDLVHMLRNTCNVVFFVYLLQSDPYMIVSGGSVSTEFTSHVAPMTHLWLIQVLVPTWPG